MPRKKIKWLWDSRIPMGKVTILESDPDLGKSLITTDLAARVTRGRAMPDGSKKQSTGTVIFIAAEDDIADTVEPRLAAAGAATKRVAHIKLKRDEKGQLIPLSIPDDLDRIELAIREANKRLPVRLIVIDPITAYLSPAIAKAVGSDPMVRRLVHR